MVKEPWAPCRVWESSNQRNKGCLEFQVKMNMEPENGGQFFKFLFQMGRYFQVQNVHFPGCTCFHGDGSYQSNDPPKKNHEIPRLSILQEVKIEFKRMFSMNLFAKSIPWNGIPPLKCNGHNRFPTLFFGNGWTSRWWNFLESMAQDLPNGSHVLSWFVWQLFSPVFFWKDLKVVRVLWQPGCTINAKRKFSPLKVNMEPKITFLERKIIFGSMLTFQGAGAACSLNAARNSRRPTVQGCTFFRFTSWGIFSLRFRGTLFLGGNETLQMYGKFEGFPL